MISFSWSLDVGQASAPSGNQIAAPFATLRQGLECGGTVEWSQ
jgi:hypothetical protein